MNFKLPAIFGTLVLGAVIAFGAGVTRATAETALPKFGGRELPQPPKQEETWRAPVGGFPANLVSSVATLFDLGLADPRGCEYREYEAVVGSVWGRHDRVKAHGWILPSRSGDPRRFAVSWAGIIYPVVSVGEKADLRQDIQSLLHEDASRRKAGARSERWRHAVPESHSISHTNMTAIKVALLLRLGEDDLARGYWDTWRATGIMNEREHDANDPFRALAFEWVWALFDRAICAHMRGDDSLALRDCRQLSRIWPLLERETERRGFPRPLSDPPRRDWFEFLEPVKALLADQERRANELPRNRRTDINAADPSTRIAELISSFDEMAPTQMGQPGGVWFGFDPIFKALVAEGEGAVEPLLDCLENDRRLTRAVSFHRDFFTHRDVRPVHSVAESVLKEILKVEFHDKSEYRRYWNQYKEVPLLERWYRVLADDEAGREQWMQAARNVLSRSSGTNTSFPWRQYAPKPTPAKQYTYIAQTLRSKTDPSVSDLLVKRALEIAPAKYTGSLDCWSFSDAADLGLMLAEWDRDAAKGALIKIIERCPALYARRETWGSGCAVVTQRLAALVVELAELGETRGLDLYAHWVRGRTLSELGDALPEVLEPFGKFPHHPSIQEASEELFRPERGDWMSVSGLLRTQLVHNKAFQTLILDALQDKSEGGAIVLLADGSYELFTKKTRQGGMITPDEFAPPLGKTVPFRVCDHVAHQLSQIEQLPKLELYWPEAKRDEALARIIRFLE